MPKVNKEMFCVVAVECTTITVLCKRRFEHCSRKMSNAILAVFVNERSRLFTRVSFINLELLAREIVI